MFNIVIFEITNKCNFNCKYCYENGKKNNIDLNILLFENFIKNNRSLFKSCILSGGEPFVNIHWNDYAGILEKYNLDINIITNGSMIKEVINKNIRINTLIISIDSFSESYNQLRSSNILCNKEDIIILKNTNLVSNIYLQIILNSYSSNINNIRDIINFCKENSIGLKFKLMDNYFFNSTSNYNLTLEQYIDVKKIIDDSYDKKNVFNIVDFPNFDNNIFSSCSILSELPSIRIRSDGVLFPCEKMNDESMAIGHIADNMNCIEYKLNKVRKKLKYRMINLSNGYCKKCSYNNNCNKGCPVLMNFDKLHPRCLKGRGSNV